MEVALRLALTYQTFPRFLGFQVQLGNYSSVLIRQRESVGELPITIQNGRRTESDGPVEICPSEFIILVIAGRNALRGAVTVHGCRALDVRGVQRGGAASVVTTSAINEIF